jgi:hypothetical protein
MVAWKSRHQGIKNAAITMSTKKDIVCTFRKWINSNSVILLLLPLQVVLVFGIQYTLKREVLMIGLCWRPEDPSHSNLKQFLGAKDNVKVNPKEI